MAEIKVLSKYRILAALVLVDLALSAVYAQWTEQTITLEPGWNAVYLQVQPEPRACEVVFSGLPIESVWLWNQRFSSVQFIQDANELLPEQPEWLVYSPHTLTKDFVSNLSIVLGGRAYLVKSASQEPIQWVVKGKPVIRSLNWMADSFNLVGFPIDSDPNTAPTFSAFLAPSPAHVGQPVYRLAISGQWERITNPNTEKIQSGRSYWVYCSGQSDYSGPLKLKLEQNELVDFGRILGEQTICIKNQTGVLRKVSIRNGPSAVPPLSQPSLAGEVLLSYWDTESLTWLDLPQTLQHDIEPGGVLGIRLAVKRSAMPGGTGDFYQSLLEISDQQGIQLHIPVVAKGMTSFYETSLSLMSIAARGLMSSLNQQVTTNVRAGLWVGMALVDKVSFPADIGQPLEPKPTGSEFTIRLIIHVDAEGNARLLQQVTLMWLDGTTKPDPEDPNKEIVDEPGRYVLCTNDEYISLFSGAAIRDGQQVGVRISSSAFTASKDTHSSQFPIDMQGAFDSTLSCNGIMTYYDDPLNPFKHKYHPDHDNLDYYFETVYPEGKESYTIERDITLIFSTEDPSGLRLPGWGDNQVGGIYEERIRGIHKKELRVQGIFRLHQASRIPLLNDEQ